MAFGRRSKGLAQTAARTAVIAGTATAVSGRVARGQAAAAAPAAVPPTAAAIAPTPSIADDGGDVIAKIERLATLHAAGALTDDEFTLLKSQAIA